ncbi:MAG: hypothetical protein PHE50_00125 [Dehalococcoidales bacterium]|nr:hypothetical protein [Dehalococcoidales bacterium]
MEKLLSIAFFVFFLCMVGLLFWVMAKKDVATPEEKKVEFDYNAWMVKKTPGIKK